MEAENKRLDRELSARAKRQRLERKREKLGGGWGGFTLGNVAGSFSDFQFSPSGGGIDNSSPFMSGGGIGELSFGGNGGGVDVSMPGSKKKVHHKKKKQQNGKTITIHMK